MGGLLAGAEIVHGLRGFGLNRCVLASGVIPGHATGIVVVGTMVTVTCGGGRLFAFVAAPVLGAVVF